MTFAQLALISLVTILGPALSLSRGVHVPVVVGELLVGILIGRTGLGVLDLASPTFQMLGDIGLAVVMFVAGSHVPVRDRALRAGARAGLGRALGVAALSGPVAALAGHEAPGEHQDASPTPA